jgi:hypothetical protein
MSQLLHLSSIVYCFLCFVGEYVYWNDQDFLNLNPLIHTFDFAPFRLGFVDILVYPFALKRKSLLELFSIVVFLRLLALLLKGYADFRLFAELLTPESFRKNIETDFGGVLMNASLFFLLAGFVIVFLWQLKKVEKKLAAELKAENFSSEEERKPIFLSA